MAISSLSVHVIPDEDDLLFGLSLLTSAATVDVVVDLATFTFFLFADTATATDLFSDRLASTFSSRGLLESLLLSQQQQRRHGLV
ncbi:hypothetical protein M0R45_000188 [Rubus argutus]|uniref:Uncharacterized protein n=1 Tax=Rubus argutus TaxID=59490 RepID=A0AAW1VNX5_RUBAR